MQHLNTLWQLVNAASAMRDITQKMEIYRFAVMGPITFYLKAEDVKVRVMRWDRPMIEVVVRMQAAFGWRLATDQDEAGVYVVAKRRPIVGSIAQGSFEVYVPLTTYLTLDMTNGDVLLEGLNSTLNIAPPIVAMGRGESPLLAAGRE